MRLIDEYRVPGGLGGSVELHQEDLASPIDAADMLVVSAFPDDYSPTPTSLIGALDAKGLSIESLARDKDIDMREGYSCWLSQSLRGSAVMLGYQRVLCFEPLVRCRPPEVVGDIFRALSPILAVRPSIQSIVLPLVATGDQGYGIREMLEPLLHAALRWLQIGLPLERIVIAVRSDDSLEEATHVFREARASFEEFRRQQHREAIGYDAFISYSHRDRDEEQLLERAVLEADPNVRLFVDRFGLEAGVAWQNRLNESIARSRRVVALLSPEYLRSKACQEEFARAYASRTESGKDVIFPVYLYSAAIADRMAGIHYVDCREGDAARIRKAALDLVATLHCDRPSR